jgi:carbonic anhydrase/acetyltransferase-like protein (isoleucine patch superfamily)
LHVAYHADAPLTIGEECTIGHNVVLHGATLEDHILVGMNAVVLSHAQIGASSIIGACALVSEHKHIPGGTLSVGIPAKVVRDLSPAEQANIDTSAQGYYERAKAHKTSIKQ